jgi:hypothetical protein
MVNNHTSAFVKPHTRGKSGPKLVTLFKQTFHTSTHLKVSYINIHCHTLVLKEYKVTNNFKMFLIHDSEIT